jgi:hypothetical protein
MDKLTNLPDLLGLHIGNPLGLSPLAMLIIIFVLVCTMTFFNHQVRYCGKDQYYPVLYTFFGLSLLAVFYYVFQADLPSFEGNPCIGWYCHVSLVGNNMFLAILGIALTTVVSFGIFIATMQIVAQVSVEAGMSLEEKRWKEWKWGLAIVLLGVCISGITYEFARTFAGWVMVITVVLTVAFTIFKIVRDTLYCGNFFWALLIGLVFLLGTAASMALFLDVIHACVYLVVFLAGFMAQAKARKKKPKK